MLITPLAIGKECHKVAVFYIDSSQFDTREFKSGLKSWLKPPLIELMGVGSLKNERKNQVATCKVRDKKQQTLDVF